MSDQSTPPPKPKPGSLRDRIAAFEKPAAGSPPGPAPVPRPKPGGLSWKPKQPSPPSSPSTADAPAEKKAGGMSASDAKESIGKGGSLKERMAALQNRGGFGGAPPIAPKPAMEKPKWKPPPAITPVDKDDDDEPSRAEIPRSAPLPPVRKSIEDQLDEDRSEELSAAVEGEDQADADPEDEERQRRAAIAARMARLGGARVGMAPVFGSKPAARKAEPVEEVAKVETLKEGEVTASTKTDDTAAIPPSDMVLEEPSSQPSAISSEKPQPLARKSSTSSSLLTPEVEAQPRTPPTSMPLPSAPRRAAPPRRKAVKSPEIPAPTVLSEPLAESPAAAAVLDSSEALDTSAVLVESAKKASEGDLEKEVGEVDKEEVEPRAIVTSLDGASALHVVDFAKERSGVDEASDDDNAADEEAATQFVDKTPVETPAEEEPNTVVASPPSLEIRDDAESDELEEKQVEAEELEGSVEEDLPSDIEETEQPVAEVVDEPEEDEEAARRQRIAEKLAKMGGVNPFAPPPQRKPSSSSEDMHPRDSIVSPSSPPQRQSMRTASVGASTVPEGVATRASDVQLTEPPIVQPPSRKNTAESTEDASDSLPRTKSQDVSRETEAVAPTSISEETEYSDTEQDVPGAGGVEGEGSKIDHEHDQVLSFEETGQSGPVSDLDDDDGVSDVEPEMPPPPPPMPNLSTRPVSVAVPANSGLPVDPALPTDPVPPPHSVGSATSPARSLPPPPPRLIPQPNEQEEEVSESEPSYPSSRSPSPSQEPSDHEHDEPLRRLPPRSFLNEETTEDDQSSPLPVPNRRSSEFDNQSGDSSRTSSGRPLKSIPPPPPLSASISDLEQDSDFDEVLPTRPRHRPMTPSTPPVTTNDIPLIVPPPTSEDASKKVEPSPLRHSAYPAPESVAAPTAPREDSPSLLSPKSSVSDQEILDEEEGDPIDPSFHSPSRRTSTILPPTSPPPEPTTEPEEDEQAARRRTIAERMAKLGGIKFGAAPLPASMRPTAPPPREEAAAEAADEQALDASEEEEERARKERIAAKLAGMGGQRIGMLPLGVGTVRPQASRVLTEATPPAPPSRAVPPARPSLPPQSHDSDVDPENSLSASQHSLASDEGVKVEAEESDIEEVSYTDADEEPEEVPPPIPVRGSRRRGTSSETEQTFASPPARPPVPTSLPSRKSSVQTTTSTARRSSAESSHSVQRSYKPQSEYVMVEEPSGFVQDEDIPPPLPPSRLSIRPPARGVPRPPSPPIPESISSQWELSSFPTSSLEFGATADLSLSWPDDANPASPSVASPPPPPPPQEPPVQQVPVHDRQLSSDDLMAVWGRVGVQICEVATTLFDKSKKTLVGDGTYDGFVHAVLSEVPNAALPSSPASYGYVVYAQSGNSVQKRVCEIMPGDVLVLQDAKLKGHKGLQTYNQSVGVGEQLVGIVSEFEPKKTKVRVFQANQHVGQQTVEAVSYRLEDLKSGTVKVYRVLES